MLILRLQYQEKQIKRLLYLKPFEGLFLDLLDLPGKSTRPLNTFLHGFIWFYEDITW